MSRVNSPLSPSPGPTYLVMMREGESHSISLTNENFPIAFSYGEKQRQVTPGSRSRKPSSSTSSSTSSSRSRTPSSAFSSTSSSLSSVHSPTSDLSSSPLWSMSPNETNLEGSIDAYIVPQNFSNPLNATQGIPSDARFMGSHSAVQQYDPSLSFSTLQQNFNNYPEGHLDNSFPFDGQNQLTHPGYSGELEWHNESLADNLNSGIDPGAFVAQHNYDQFPLMDQPVVPTTRGPSPSSISSGGQPIGYLPEFVYPESQQIPHSASNDVMYMHGQQNFDIYSQGYEDPSIIISDPSTPRPPDYHYNTTGNKALPTVEDKSVPLGRLR